MLVIKQSTFGKYLYSHKLQGFVASSVRNGLSCVTVSLQTEFIEYALLMPRIVKDLQWSAIGATVRPMLYAINSVCVSDDK